MLRRLPPHGAAIGYAFTAAVLTGLLFTSGPARADLNVRLDIGNAPPAPRMAFRARPHEVYIPEERIYVVDDPGAGDYDSFRYGGYYWMFSDGYWYRAPSWRDRFVVVNPRYVPTAFYRVPAARWKHRPSGPPSFARSTSTRSPAIVRGPVTRRPAVVTTAVSRRPAVVKGTVSRSPAVGRNRPSVTPGQAKKGNSGSQGHSNKGDKDQDNKGGHGGK